MKETRTSKLQKKPKKRTNLGGVVDALGVLAYDPDHARLCLGVVESVEVFAEGADDVFVLVWVFAQNVADHYHRLCCLSHVTHTYTHTQTHTRTHTCTHAHTNTHTHAHDTNTHTHTHPHDSANCQQ